MRSPTYGRVTMTQVAELIVKRVRAGGGPFNLTIGTDSQNHDDTKMVVVIALHDVGHGGIFFYDIQHTRRIGNVKEKLIYETSLSLQYTELLLEEFEKIGDFDYERLLNFSIHVDAGYDGKSSQVIPEITGWVRACGYKVCVKPDSFAASSIANKYSK